MTRAHAPRQGRWVGADELGQPCAILVSRCPMSLKGLECQVFLVNSDTRHAPRQDGGPRGGEGARGVRQVAYADRTSMSLVPVDYSME